MPSPLSRRTLLRGGLSAAAAAAAAGCSGPAATPSPTPDASPAPLGLSFPDGFAWGVATAAYQIEGATTEDGRGPSIWDTFAKIPGHIRNGDTADVADDHYHRWAADLDLMKSLNIRSYRFSIAWPRILPAGTGTPNQKGIDFYRRLVDGLHQRGIAAMATLFHWDLPQALQDRGGWASRDCASWFADYARVMFDALADPRVSWLTLNEPKTVVQEGYLNGDMAPGQRNPDGAVAAGHHMLLGHGMAVRAFRAAGHGGRIGIALNLAPAYPAGQDEGSRQAVPGADLTENRLYLDPVLTGRYPADTRGVLGADAWRVLQDVNKPGDLAIIASPIDLLGVNYYNPVYVTAAGSYVTARPTSLAGWQQIYPAGLTDLLVRLKKDYGDLPLSVTENGIPERDRVASGAVADPDRIGFLRDHFAAAHKAIQAGVRLEGYHVWSLLDNFEWAQGYSQRWGIVYVDYPTQRRIPKASALWYRDVIARNGV